MAFSDWPTRIQQAFNVLNQANQFPAQGPGLAS